MSKSAAAMPGASVSLSRVARAPGLRALAWDGDLLYVARGYQLLRARVSQPTDSLSWEFVAGFQASWRRRLSVANRLSARLFRDGFHALAVLSSGALVGAVPGAIVTYHPGEPEFRVTHAITRGTRPLHITAVPGGAVYWGEYFNNSGRDAVHIYASTDQGATWAVAYTFPKGSIRHVHNIVHDRFGDCLWILTGDYVEECRILRASCDLTRVETVLQGNQQARAVALVPLPDALYFSTDTPLETNYVYRLERGGNLTRLSPLSTSSIYGCRVGDRVFFSTMVEPGRVNPDRYVRLYASSGQTLQSWQSVALWPKDMWPLGLFQYGNALLPDGGNSTPYLAVTTVAVSSEDQVTSLYSVDA
jgi:hypothetical protein